MAESARGNPLGPRQKRHHPFRRGRRDACAAVLLHRNQSRADRAHRLLADVVINIRVRVNFFNPTFSTPSTISSFTLAAFVPPSLLRRRFQVDSAISNCLNTKSNSSPAFKRFSPARNVCTACAYRRHNHPSQTSQSGPGARPRICTRSGSPASSS